MGIQLPQKSSNKKEQRKEKSRNAARCRRKNESESYQSLIKLLPIESETLSNVDQGTGLCLVNRFIQLRTLLPKCIKDSLTWSSKSYKTDKTRDYSSIENDMLEASNGFLLIVDHTYKTLFVSHNTKQHLGVNETDIVGHDLRSLIHEGDHDQVLAFFSKCCNNEENKGNSNKRLFCRVRTSFEVARNGRGKFKNGTGHYQTFKCNFVQFGKAEKVSKQFYGVFIQAIPQPSSELLISFSSSCFLTYHSLDYKFIKGELTKFNQTIGYEKNEVIGRSFFEYCHPLDIKKASQTLANMSKWRQVEFGPYRFLCKRGGWVDLLTQANRVSEDGCGGKDTIVFLHYICGSKQHEKVLMSVKQIAHDKVEVKELDDKLPSDFDDIDLNKSFSLLNQLQKSLPMLADDFDEKLEGEILSCSSLAEVEKENKEEFSIDCLRYDGIMGDKDPHLPSIMVESPERSNSSGTAAGCDDSTVVSPPSTYDPIEFYSKQLNMNDEDDADCQMSMNMLYENCDDSENICFNAPSIGDPWCFGEMNPLEMGDANMLFPEAQVNMTTACYPDHNIVYSPVESCNESSKSPLESDHQNQIDMGYCSSLSSPEQMVHAHKTPPLPYHNHHAVYNDHHVMEVDKVAQQQQQRANLKRRHASGSLAARHQTTTKIARFPPQPDQRFRVPDNVYNYINDKRNTGDGGKPEDGSFSTLSQTPPPHKEFDDLKIPKHREKILESDELPIETRPHHFTDDYIPTTSSSVFGDDSDATSYHGNNGDGGGGLMRDYQESLLCDRKSPPGSNAGLPVLSLDDCEVNAPCTVQGLLVGPIDQLLD